MGGPTDMPRFRDIMLRDRYTQEMIDKLVGPEFPRAFQPFLEGLSSAYYRVFESVLTERPYPIRTVISPGHSHPSAPADHGVLLRPLKNSISMWWLTATALPT
jgi:hypothetical protein